MKIEQTLIMMIIIMMQFFQMPLAMLIPEQREILEGFGYEESYPEALPNDEYFEARSLSVGPLINSIRNKRSNDVEATDSLISYFQPTAVLCKDESQFDRSNRGRALRKFKKWLKKKIPQDDSDEFSDESSDSITFGNMILSPSKRRRRSVENEKMSKVAALKEENKSNKYSENLSLAMKLTKTSTDGENSEFSPSIRNIPTASALIGKFPRSPFEYSKIQHEEDFMAMDKNEGIKSRTPRVNFVTQQKKSLDHADTKESANKSDFYKRSPPLLHNSKNWTATTSNERYPHRSNTNMPSFNPNRDTNINHYDYRYIEDMYPHPPNMYDPMFIDLYGYPGNRYDMHDYRAYPPMYGNEIDNRYYMRTDLISEPLPPSTVPPRKRTIYYAYLPEIVRSPPTVDFRYRSHDRYDKRGLYFPNYYSHYKPLANNAFRREKASKYDYRTPRTMKVDFDVIGTSSSLKEQRFDNGRSFNDNNIFY